MHEQYLPAAERWNESSYGPYGDGVSSPALPVYRPSVVKDLKWATRNLVGDFQRGTWLARTSLFIGVWLGLLVLGAFHFAYWAEWEKLAWYWTRTDADEEFRKKGRATPPRWHQYRAYFVGVVWGSLSLMLTALLWVTVAAVVSVLT